MRHTGNKFKCDNRRKVMVLSFSFLEFGGAALTDERRWYTPVILRHCIIEKVVGGWSYCLRMFLRRLLLGPLGLASAGMSLSILGRAVLIKGTVTNLLSDGDGLRSALDWRGAAGMKPCFFHWNIFRKDSDLSHRQPGYCEISSCNPQCWQKMTGADLATIIDTLIAADQRAQEGTITKTRVENMGQMLGFNANPNGLLADPELRQILDPTATVTYDWVHSALQDGMLSIETWLFVQACNPLGLTHASLVTFLSDPAWCFPKATHGKSKNLYRVFDSFRSMSSDKADKLKCNASELLSLYVLIRHYAEVHIRNHEDIRLEWSSFQAACHVIDLILITKYGMTDPQQAASALRLAMTDHMRKHISAYGTSHVKPKHHWLFDCAAQVARDGLVLDAFIIERRHLAVKSIAENRKDTTWYERSVLSGVVLEHKKIIKGGIVSGCLTGRVRKLGGLTLSSAASYLALHISVGDVVFHGVDAGQVITCAQDQGGFVVVVQRFTLVEKVSAHSQKFIVSDEHDVWHLGATAQCCAWYSSGDGIIIIRM